MSWVDLTSRWAKCTPHHRIEDTLTMRFVCFPYLCNFTCGRLNLQSTCPLLTLSTPLSVGLSGLLTSSCSLTTLLTCGHRYSPCPDTYLPRSLTYLLARSDLAYIGLAYFLLDLLCSTYLSSTSPDLLTCLTSHDLLISHLSSFGRFAYLLPVLLCSIRLSFARLTYLPLVLLCSTHLCST